MEIESIEIDLRVSRARHRTGYYFVAYRLHKVENILAHIKNMVKSSICRKYLINK